MFTLCTRDLAHGALVSVNAYNSDEEPSQGANAGNGRLSAIREESEAPKGMSTHCINETTYLQAIERKLRKGKEKMKIQLETHEDDDDGNATEDAYDLSQDRDEDAEDEDEDELLSDPDDIDLVRLAQDSKALKVSTHVQT